jgi:hypothetical protein
MRRTITKEMFQYIPEIDYSIGYRYFLGNMDHYASALMSIFKSVRSKLPILQSMCLSEEYEGLRTIAQTLRKLFQNVGALGLVEETYQLETALLNEEEDLQLQLTYYISSLTDLSEHLERMLINVDKQDTESSVCGQETFLNYDFTETKESIRRSSDYLKRKII